MHRRTLCVALIVLASLANSTTANTISVNLNNGGATLVAEASEVGFVPSANWNNFRNNGGLGLFNPDPTDLLDSTGALSDASISWEVGGSGFNRNNGLGNQRMMEGWFGLNADDDGYIMIQDLPSFFTTPTYDAYVYFDSPEIAPDEQTMTFTANGVSVTGKELPGNFGGLFFEANDNMAGNYVVFRDLNAPTFRLTADSDFGRAAITGLQITTLPEPEPTEPPDPNAPIHSYVAATAGNTADRFTDNSGNNNWALVGAELVDVASANSSITSAYRLTEPDQGFGGDAAPFPAGNVTYEMWVRRGENTEGNQVVFETGGGQNGTSILVGEDTIRLLNSRTNERGFDIEVPLGDIDTSDFLQIVASLDQSEQEITLTVNGSAGGTVSASAEGVVGRGGNRASLFTWGSGLQNLGNPDDAPGGTFNLGGRTELEDMTPDGLSQFAGEIAILNVYSRAFDAGEIQAAFESITTPGLPGDFNADGQLGVDDIDALSAIVQAGSNDLNFDLNGDSAVNGNDHEIWIVNLKNTWYGDSNLDGEFNSGDFVQVFIAGEFEDGVPLNSTWATGDWDGDGDFTTSDFVTAFVDGGFEIGPRNATKAVPEPAGNLVALFLLFSIAVRMRRFRRAITEP